MKSEERLQLLRIEVLRILNDCAGYLLPDPRLKEQLRLSVMPPPTESECDETLKFLDSEGHIAGVRPELGGPVKWKITDKGRSCL
jgi:hypothetical protein